MAVETEERKEEVNEKEASNTENKEEDTNMGEGAGAGEKADDPVGADDVKVKIAEVDTKVEMGKESGFTGMTKEELMKYANDPFWVRLRWGLFILFWLIWIGMLVASVVIIVLVPKCPSPEPRKWYMKGPIYEVAVAKFKDSDGDGVGDLKGLTNELDYLVETGVNAVWLNDLAQGKEIKSTIGNKDDFLQLVKGMKDRELKLIINLENGAPEETAKYWLDLGVDGFNARLAIPALKKVRALLVNSTEKMLMNDGTTNSDVNQLYGTGIADNNISPLVHLPFSNIDLVAGFQPGARAGLLNDTIMNYIGGLPTNAWPNFALHQNGQDRVSTLVGDMVDAMNMLVFLLPGTPITYYGEEIGMKNTGSVNTNPMQWSNTSQAGFSASQGALGVNSDYPTINVAAQKMGEQKRSHYGNYVKLAELRHQEAILFGEMETFLKNNETVFGLTRVKRGNPGYLLLINLSDKETKVNLIPAEGEGVKVKKVPGSIRMMTKSVGATGVEDIPAEEIKAFDSTEAPLKPREAVIFTFVPDFED